MFTIDYETEAITDNPIWLPPHPVGVSIKHEAAPSKYYAWGHPTGNNCTEQEANKALYKVWTSGEEVLCHNAPFDISIASKYHGFNLKDPLRILDTQYSIFFTEPYAESFALKPSAARILGVPPDEQGALRDWIIANVPEARRKPKEWGAHISKAPGDLVGVYAVGDTDRTYALHQKLQPIVMQNGMLEAYRREQYLMPTLIQSSREGIRIDRTKLEEDYADCQKLLRKVDRWFHKVFGTEVNMDKDAEVARALRDSGVVRTFVKTPTGRDSVSRKNLISCIEDKDFLVKFNYRGALATMLTTFMGPWVEFSSRDGRLHTEWNQVRGDKSSKNMAGARTGRMSSMKPNFQNVSTEFSHQPDKWPVLPMMRSYLLPEEGHVWLKRDFSAQEMRIAAHFEEGSMMRAFMEDPDMDPHDFVREKIREVTSMNLPRKHVKITGFQILYGGGKSAIAGQVGCTIEEAASLKNTYFAAMPGFQDLSRAVSARGKRGEYIRTWGGRVYYKEPDRINTDTGARMEFSYKLLNYLIQGSAADQTKQAIVDWAREKSPKVKLLAAVHDEVNISVPEGSEEHEMAYLRDVMNKDRFDVPMRSEGYKGTNWQGLTKWEPK